MDINHIKHKSKYFRLFLGLFLLGITILLLFFSIVVEASPKFLIFHLDAVSSKDFFQLMEEGYLPNLKNYFKDGNIIKYGLSLFPGGTEMIYPHLKRGLDNSEGKSVGWGYYDRNQEKVIPEYKTFFYMFSHIPRRAKISMLYGIPGLDTFMFLPLLNIPQLLETYGVVEFFWFTTDALGHKFNKKLHHASIRRFDRYFGNLLRKLHLEELNIIVYSDHGMSFGDFLIINHQEEIERTIGDNLQVFLYPNLYLKNPDLKDKNAQDIALESEIDFAFYREDFHRVIGYSNQGKMIFEEDEKKIRYLYEGKDVLGYYAAGYNGEWLTALDWLVFTRESRFPAVPPNIYYLLANERVGDIVTVVNPPKLTSTLLRYTGGHAGVMDTDLLVPILIKGPELKHLYGREEMWLHNLYINIPKLSFENLEPAREKNSFSFWGSGLEEHRLGFEMSLSPAYRWNFGLHYNNDIYRNWIEYDLYSSYVIRLWTGVGWQYQEQSWEALVNTRLQIDFGNIQFNYGGQYTQKGWEVTTKKIAYQINNSLALEWFIPDGLGLSFSW